MSLICETCGAENPSTNRFCGQCGSRFGRVQSDTPEEFWRPIGGAQIRDRFEASADLSPEVIEFDNKVPLIAGEGTDRRNHPPSELVEQVHAQLERESELHDQLKHGKETHFEAQQQRESGGFPQWDANVPTGKPKVNDPPDNSALNFKIGSASTSTDLPEPELHFVAETGKSHSTGVSGPSFLGLTDDRPTEYEDEELRQGSHARRNIALAIAAAIVILVGLQWRSVRDYGLAYMQNGSMQIKSNAQKSAETPPPAVAADHSNRELGQATPPAADPKAVENSPNADHILPAQQADASHNSSPPHSSPPPSPEPSAIPPAMSAPTPEPAKHPPVPATVHLKTPRPESSVPVGKISERDLPGADEMRRAANASDAEARAAWLWKAVGKGNPRAQVELAKMYEQGTGVVRNCDQAQLLLSSAAARGNQEAKIDLLQIRMHGCSSR